MPQVNPVFESVIDGLAPVLSETLPATADREGLLKQTYEIDEWVATVDFPRGVVLKDMPAKDGRPAHKYARVEEVHCHFLDGAEAAALTGRPVKCALRLRTAEPTERTGGRRHYEFVLRVSPTPQSAVTLARVKVEPARKAGSVVADRDRGLYVNRGGCIWVNRLD